MLINLAIGKIKIIHQKGRELPVNIFFPGPVRPFLQEMLGSVVSDAHIQSTQDSIQEHMFETVYATRWARYDILTLTHFHFP